MKLDLPGKVLYNLTESVMLDEMTVLDMKNLSSAIAQHEYIKLFDVYSKRLHGINLSDLAIQDLEYIFLADKFSSDDSPLQLPIKCPHCNEDTVLNIKYSDLLVNDLDPKYKNDARILLRSGNYIFLRIPRVKDLMTYYKLNKDSLNLESLNSPEIIFDLLSLIVRKPENNFIGDMDLNMKDLELEYNKNSDFVLKSITQKDIQLIFQLFESKFNFGLISELHKKCPECDEMIDTTFNVSLLQEIPSSENGNDMDLRVSFDQDSEITTFRDTGSTDKSSEVLSREIQRRDGETFRTNSEPSMNNSSKILNTSEVIDIINKSSNNFNSQDKNKVKLL